MISFVDHFSWVAHALRIRSPPAASYPEPCSHCASCHWKDACAAQWQNDDHLSLVANIQRSQTAKLERAGIKTVAQLAALPKETRIPDLNPQVFDRLRSQAALQEHKRQTNANKFELLDSEDGRGFSRMPKPDAGDLFFDMEGDPLYPQGLEYLFGISFLKGGELTFLPFWAHTHEEERATFAQFMEFLKQHLTAHPNAYIYHYNHYETTALKRSLLHTYQFPPQETKLRAGDQVTDIATLSPAGTIELIDETKLLIDIKRGGEQRRAPE